MTQTTIIVLLLCVTIFMLAFNVVLIVRYVQALKKNRESLRKADYHYAVQAELISAHNNPDFVDQALMIVGAEMGAETVLLLTFTDKIITRAQYWPSKDKTQAMSMLGINVRDIFPMFFDELTAKKSVFYEVTNDTLKISNTAKSLFESLSVSNIMLTPITDNTGMLKGVIAAVNISNENQKTELLECVTRDFFMAITNLENYNIIKKMGEIDYLTGLKNRNSFEAESSEYERMDANTLGCMFVDVNGLHELNNQRGHKAGDVMLCDVASSVKKIFGEKYTYRFGGDEFLAFGVNVSSKDFANFKKQLIKSLYKKGYSASVGFDVTEKSENGEFDVDKIIANAESFMYNDKMEYYKRNNIPVERRYLSPEEK